MSTDREAIIARIQKILAKAAAGSGATQAEMEAAVKAANRLLLENNLSMEEIRQESARAERKSEFIQEEAGKYDWQLPPESEFISGVLVSQFFVVVTTYQGKSGGKPITYLRFFGDRPNVETAKFVYHFLVGQYKALWTQAQAKNQWPVNERRAYYLGLSIGLKEKLAEERSRTVQEAASAAGSPNALVLVKNQLARVQGDLEAAFHAEHKKITYHNIQTPVGSADAQRQGVRDGRNINIAKPLSGPSRPSNSITRKP